MSRTARRANHPSSCRYRSSCLSASARRAAANGQGENKRDEQIEIELITWVNENRRDVGYMRQVQLQASVHSAPGSFSFQGTRRQRGGLEAGRIGWASTPRAIPHQGRFFQVHLPVLIRASIALLGCLCWEQGSSLWPASPGDHISLERRCVPWRFRNSDLNQNRPFDCCFAPRLRAGRSNRRCHIRWSGGAAAQLGRRAAVPDRSRHSALQGA